MQQPIIEKLTCLQCGETFRGNENKKFCDDSCKNAYHNARRKKESEEIGEVILILKTNRRVIKELLNGKQVKNVSLQSLLDKGYVFRYHTHLRVNKGDGKEYTFCFDHGYYKHSSGWYTLVRSSKE